MEHARITHYMNHVPWIGLDHHPYVDKVFSHLKTPPKATHQNSTHRSGDVFDD